MILGAKVRFYMSGVTRSGPNLRGAIEAIRRGLVFALVKLADDTGYATSVKICSGHLIIVGKFYDSISQRVG